jgi:bacteriocin biosynthesis cyclodehydratase domain-containing protein
MDRSPALPSENPPLPKATHFRALPVQLVKIDGGALIVRGCTEIRVVGERAEETVRELWSMAAEAPVTLQALASRYAEPDRASIAQLAQKLIDRRILVDAEKVADAAGDQDGDETGLEIFYWHFGLTERDATSLLNQRKIAIIGVNAISRRLAAALAEANVGNVEVVDYVLTRNQRLFGREARVRPDGWPQACRAPIPYATWIEQHDPDGIDCLVATSDHGATSALLDWNRHCLSQGISFLPVVLRRMVGLVGPFVVPTETACYECLCARENSHLSEYKALRASEEMAPHGQAVSGFFPSMGSILGDIAALELVKFYTGGMPYKVGHLIEVSLLAPSLTSRKVLRVPRCRACAPTTVHPSHSLERADFIPGPQFFEGHREPDARVWERFNIPARDEA